MSMDGGCRLETSLDSLRTEAKSLEANEVINEKCTDLFDDLDVFTRWPPENVNPISMQQRPFQIL